MAGNSRNLFKPVSMLLVAASLYSAFGILRGGEVRFWISLCVTSLIGIAYLILYLQKEKEFLDLKSKAEAPPPPDDNSSVSRFFLNNCPFPTIIINENGRVLKKTGGAAELFPDVRENDILSECLSIDPANYMPEAGMETRTFEWDNFSVSVFTAQNTEASGKFYTLLSFRDMRELLSLKDEAEDNRNYAAIILIDNFDELFYKAADSDKALVTAQIDKLTETFIEKHNGILKKISDDRYFAIISEKEIRAMMEEKFNSFINEIHKITVSDRFPVTLSMGIGRGGANLRESEEIARSALEMTQRRGGDQIAVKYSRIDSKYNFFGGQSERIEDNDKTRNRVFSNNLYDLISGSDIVLLMGHARSDMDAVGSASGLCGAIRAMGFRSHVFVNKNTTQAMSVIKRLQPRIDSNLPSEDDSNIIDEYKELFISEEEALSRMTENTLLIITDVSNKAQLDSIAIYEKAEKVVYIDHHMEERNIIDNALNKRVDNKASSASEIVTEIIQFLPLDKKLPRFFADGLLAGITLDTKDFVIKTRTRTYEAAAYLKSLDADPFSVKKLFANSLEDNILRSKFIENAEIYKKCVITYIEEKYPNISVIAAQAADQLLNTRDVQASFAAYPGIDKDGDPAAIISARSFGTDTGGLSVQPFMVKLGGGGQQTQAAASVKGISPKELTERLKAVIDEYRDSVKPIGSPDSGSESKE